MVKLLFKWLLVFFSPAAHPVYISVTEINHNAADKTLEITCKFFTDDFEQVLTKKAGAVISITKPKDKAALDQVIADYILERLSLKTDGRPVQLSFLGFEKEEDVTYCYLQAGQAAAPQKVEASNTLLHDLNSNQINIMHVIVNGKRISTKLDFPKSGAVFEFK